MPSDPRGIRDAVAARSTSGQPTPRKLLVSAAGQTMAPLLALSARTFQAYAYRHGYDLEVHAIRDDGDRSSDLVRAAKWRKVSLLRSALDRADIVLWIDADAAIRRFDRDIADELPTDSFQGLVLERFTDRCNPNTGVWLLRGSGSARCFLDDVLATGQLAHSWADQATVCHLLGWELGDHHGRGARPRRTTRHRAGTTWLDRTWNDVGAEDGAARIRHLAGRPLDERRTRIANIVAGLSASGALDR